MRIKEEGHALLLVLIEICVVDLVVETSLTGRNAPVSGRKRPCFRRLSSRGSWLALLVESVILNFGVLNTSPMLDAEIKINK